MNQQQQHSVLFTDFVTYSIIFIYLYKTVPYSLVFYNSWAAYELLAHNIKHDY